MSWVTQDNSCCKSVPLSLSVANELNSVACRLGVFFSQTVMQPSPAAVQRPPDYPLLSVVVNGTQLCVPSESPNLELNIQANSDCAVREKQLCCFLSVSRWFPLQLCSCVVIDVGCDLMPHSRLSCSPSNARDILSFRAQFARQHQL